MIRFSSVKFRKRETAKIHCRDRAGSAWTTKDFACSSLCPLTWRKIGRSVKAVFVENYMWICGKAAVIESSPLRLHLSILECPKAGTLRAGSEVAAVNQDKYTLQRYIRDSRVAQGTGSRCSPHAGAGQPECLSGCSQRSKPQGSGKCYSRGRSLG